MAKRRQIHPEIWTDDKFVSLDPLARLLFIGMWNFACDNGHLDDSVLQLKMRVLPAESADVAPLLAEVIEQGMVVRENGYLKVVNLSARQALDMRYLVFCDHCENDPTRRYTDEDKVGKKGAPKGGTTSARGEPQGDSVGTPRSGVGDGVGDGVGEGSKRRKPSLPIPDDWKPNTKHAEYADEHGIDLSTEAFKFRNHAIGKDRRQADWDAAFRNWLASDFVVKAAPPQPESRNIARLPKCPTCNAPQEVIHYDDCTDQAWRPTA